MTVCRLGGLFRAAVDKSPDEYIAFVEFEGTLACILDWLVATNLSCEDSRGFTEIGGILEARVSVTGCAGFFSIQLVGLKKIIDSANPSANATRSLLTTRALFTLLPQERLRAGGHNLTLMFPSFNRLLVDSCRAPTTHHGRSNNEDNAKRNNSTNAISLFFWPSSVVPSYVCVRVHCKTKRRETTVLFFS
jgi:hypothetical protein